MNQFALIAVVAIFSANISTFFGIGAIGLQSEKRNFSFMLVSSLLLIVSAVLSGLTYAVLETYLLVRLKAEYLKLFIVVLLSVIFAFVSKSALKWVSKEKYFLYERSYSMPIQTVLNVGLLMIIDFSAKLTMSLYALAMYLVGYLLAQILFFALYERLDSTDTLKPARNVPVMLYTLSILGMILYAVGMFF